VPKSGGAGAPTGAPPRRFTATRRTPFAAEKASRKEAIAAERANLLAALSHQNEIWSLRFENYMAKGEKFKKDDGLPPPSSPSDSKSE
jgi:lipase chaperone LimK